MEFSPLVRRSRGLARTGLLGAMLLGILGLLVFIPSPQAQVGRPVSYTRISEPAVAPSVINVRNLLRATGGLQAQAALPSLSLGPQAGPVNLSFDTAQDTGNIEPPDSGLAVGPNHVVAAYNVAWGVWDKVSGRRITLVPFTTFYQGLDNTGNIIHPRVDYDASLQRWYMVSVGHDQANTRAAVQIAVSVNSDPLGSWYRYVFNATEGNPIIHWLDAPSFGYNSLAFFVSGNATTFATPATASHVTLRTFSKSLMLAGQPVTPVTLTNIGGAQTPAITPFSIQPVTSYDATTIQWMVEADTAGRSALRVWKVTNPLSSAPLITQTSISVPTWGAPPAMSQQGAMAPTLNGGDGRLGNAILRNGQIWTSHGVGDGTTANRGEIRVYQLAASGAGSLARSYTINNNIHQFFYPSLDINGFGAVLVGFNTTAANEHIGIGYAVKAATDLQFGAHQTMVAGAFDYTPRAATGSPWGLYSDTQFDPSNPSLVWHQNELAATTSTWKLTVGSISASPTSFDITSPNGGETLLAGETHTITWRSTGFITPGQVRLELSRNGGTSYDEVISTGTEDDGSFDWVVTAPVDNACRVRITSLLDTTVVDTSNANFRIVDGELVVIAPNGGEVVQLGGQLPIQWSATDFADVTSNPTVKIELSRDGGLSWSTLFASTPNDGEELWTASGLPTDEALIRVTANATPVFTDESDDLFEIRIPSTIQVTYPNGGEELVDGSEVAIQWATSGVVTDVRVELSRNGGSTWETLFPSTPNETNELDKGEVFWTVRGPFTRLARIRVTDVSDDSVTDTSNGVFKIVVPSIQVTGPVANRRVLIGQTEKITWNSTGIDANSDVQVELSRDGGDTWEEISAFNANSGFLDWQVEGDETSAALVRVTSLDNPEVFGLSQLFSVVEPSISLTSPVGREIWRLGSQARTTWTGTTLGQGTVTIELSRNGLRGPWERILTNTPNDGGEAWGVRGRLSNKARVRILWNPSPIDIQDESPANFRILKALRGRGR